MKKKFKILSYAFFIITLLVFIGCQVDDTILETKSNTENTKGYSVRKISISEMQNNEKLKIPLESLSKTFDVNKVIKNNNITQNANSKIYSNDGNITLLTDNILETSTDSSATYTFILETPTDFESDFENFVVEIKNNDEYNFYLLKYKLNNNSIDFPYSTTIQTVSNNSFNIDDFNNQINGKVQAIYSDGCTFIFVESGCSCDGSSSWTLIDYWCGGGGSGGGGSSGSGGSGSGGFGGGSGGGYGGGSGGGGSNTGSGSNNGNSGGPTSPISVIESAETQAQIKREKAFKLQLNWTQSPWLNNNQEAENSIYEYLESQVTDPLASEYSVESVQFAEELIDYLILNPSIACDFVLSNRTVFDENQAEIEDYQLGGFDNTSYASFNPQTDPWPSISTVIPQNKFVGWGASGVRRNCMDYAKAQIAKVGYQISSYYASGQTFQIYTTQNGVNNTNLSNGISYLKYALSNGIPVIVGVDDAPGHPGNLDNSTDHFIVIVGMGTNSTGNYFQFYDNASGNVSQGASSLNLLYYDSNTGIISGNSQTDYANNQPLPYTITMIRKSKPL